MGETKKIDGAAAEKFKAFCIYFVLAALSMIISIMLFVNAESYVPLDSVPPIISFTFFLVFVISSTFLFYCAKVFRKGIVLLNGKIGRFSPTPQKLLSYFKYTIIIGSIFVLLGTIPLFIFFGGLTTQIVSQTSSSGMQSFIDILFTLFTMALYLGIILLMISMVIVYITVGYGVWKIGTYYKNSLIKITTILWLIPILDIIACVLFYICLRSNQ